MVKPQFLSMPIEALPGKEFTCSCGKIHKFDTGYLKIGRGAVNFLPEALARVGGSRPLLVCDKNTYKAAGIKASSVLTDAGISHRVFIIPGDNKLEPNEYTVGAVAMNLLPTDDSIIAIGGGVINDTVKVISHISGKPNIILGTGPSMDGFASNSSSMVVNGVKTTLYNACPRAIVLDTEIMAAAPIKMIKAGIGDMLAKAIAICEWRISNIVTGEYYCPHVAEIMRNALKEVIAASEGAYNRDPDAIEKVAKGLVLAGMGMAYAQVSRPASGLEHYFSHSWEMLALLRGEISELHGIQVGVGTLLTLKLYKRLKAETPNDEKAMSHINAFDNNKWESDIKSAFGVCADDLINIEKKAQKNNKENCLARYNNIKNNWDKIITIINEELGCGRELVNAANYACLPMSATELGISDHDLAVAYYHSRDLRDKYLTSSMLFDMGLLNEYAPTVLNNED